MAYRAHFPPRRLSSSAGHCLPRDGADENYLIAPFEDAALGKLAPPECPALPEGVRLVRYAPKHPPVAISVCSIVVDVDKFITDCLEELQARLRSPIQIRAGGSVYELVSKLAEVGVEVKIELP